MAYLKINRENFFYNLNEIALKTGSVDKIAIVLKDNAYGHGLNIMAKLSSSFGVTTAVVRDEYEANEIYELFDSIIILNGKATQNRKFRFTINSIEDIQNAQKYSKIDLKIDTGMHRNGVSVKELDEALRLVVDKELHLVGVMTHYRSADDLSSEFFWQKKVFEEVKEFVLDRGFKGVEFHSHNSAALFRQTSFSEDLARVGLAAYGYLEIDSSFSVPELRPVKSLYAKRVSTRELSKSQRVGYGGTFTASKNMIVSTYDLGYGDGWPRAVDLDPYILPKGSKVLGRVSMDFISVESVEDDICIMDNAKDLAKYLNTIVYEVLTSTEPKGPTLIMP